MVSLNVWTIVYGWIIAVIRPSWDEHQEMKSYLCTLLTELCAQISIPAEIWYGSGSFLDVPAAIKAVVCGVKTFGR